MERKLANLVKHALQFICIAGFVMAISIPASATSIAIQNYSFENPALTEGLWNESIPGWAFDGGTGTYGAGVWYPSVSQVGPGDDFLPVPDGDQVAWSNGGDIRQTLGATLTVGYRYTLTVYLGGREGYSDQPYAVLLAGGNELNSSSGFNSANPAWNKVTVIYSSMPGDINAGQQLTIKLMNYGSYPGQINYDKVALDASLVLTCQGFLPPFDKPLTLKKKVNRAIPVKIVLYDLLGNIITDADVAAPPVINVTYDNNENNNTIVGYNGDLVPPGLSDAGNALRYDPLEQIWIINLATKQFTAPGLYTVTVKPGDDSYVIEGCSQTFTRLP